MEQAEVFPDPIALAHREQNSLRLQPQRLPQDRSHILEKFGSFNDGLNLFGPSEEKLYFKNTLSENYFKLKIILAFMMIFFMFSFKEA